MFALVLVLVACDRVPLPNRAPALARADWRQALFHPPPTAPPPPPPPPIDPEGIGPEEPPREIAAFVHGIAPRNGPPKVTLFRFDEKRGKRSVVLPPAAATEALVHLTSPFTWTEYHPMCTDEGFGMRIESGGKVLNLDIGLICRHVHLAESGEEIGFLTGAGEKFFTKLVDHTFQTPEVENEGRDARFQPLDFENEDPDVRFQPPDLENEDPDVRFQPPELENEGPDLHFQPRELENQGPDLCFQPPELETKVPTFVFNLPSWKKKIPTFVFNLRSLKTRVRRQFHVARRLRDLMSTAKSDYLTARRVPRL